MRSIVSLMVLTFIVVILLSHRDVRVLEAKNEAPAALLEWKASLDNQSQSVLISWDRNSSCQSWIGIKCSHTPQSEWVVIDISLSNKRLKGSLDSFNFSSFRHLEVLDFSNNSLFGSIPSNLANVSRLQYIDLGWNDLSGVIPSEIGMLTLLEELHLTSNRLTGHIPNSLGNLTNLIALYLFGNDLTGPIPQEIGMLSAKLEYLDFSYNNLLDEIPSSLGNLTHLHFLFLFNNHLSGPIPDSFRNFTSLEYMWLSSNNLSGSFPKDINFSNIRSFIVDNNMFSGSLPRFGKLVESIAAKNNLFSGGIPLDIGSSSSLEFLDLSGNQLFGSIPLEIGNSSSLLSLDLSRNKLSGPIPHTILNLTSLIFLNLDDNMLSGTLPKLPITIFVFSVKNNKIAGGLPSGICSLKFLEVLHLSNNKIGGALPDCFIKCNLTSLDLNGNRLQGKVPKSLINCEFLQVLDLGNNMITDKFPNWLDTLPQLQVLVLKSNKLHGTIVSFNNKLPFPKLRIIDLSGNLFTGCLPSMYFENFKAMMDIDEKERVPTYVGKYEDSVDLVVKGLKIRYERIFNVLTTIDLSDNKFEGGIPSNIKMLNSLRYLNLSHNHLSGKIPPMLDKLTILESFDISSNRVKGNIPTELIRLTFLIVFNVSGNQLSGTIPQGPQFNTFENDSYQGNPGLCGFPLPNKCGDTNEQSQFPRLQLEEDDTTWFFDGFTWESVVLGYGCGIVLGVGLGYLMFSTGKPIWVMKIVNTKRDERGLRFFNLLQ